MGKKQVCCSHEELKFHSSQTELHVGRLQLPAWSRDGVYEPKYRDEIGYHIINRPIKMMSHIRITLWFSLKRFNILILFYAPQISYNYCYYYLVITLLII